jgi:glutamyl/glutaminyl-tRNA synthetase
MITRFAPSPTGHPHLGSLMIAFVNYIYSKKHNGKFLLRIEDSDLSRSKSEYEKEIIDSLKKFEIIPDNINDYPKQSQRIEIYKKYARKLVEKGLAYYNPLPLKKDYLLEIYLRYKIFSQYVDFEINGLLYEEIVDYIKSQTIKYNEDGKYKSIIEQKIEDFLLSKKKYDTLYEKIGYLTNLVFASLYNRIIFTKEYAEKSSIEELQDLLSALRIATNRDNNYIRQEKYYHIDQLIKSGKIKVDKDKSAVVLMVIPHHYTDNYKWNYYYPEIREKLYKPIVKNDDDSEGNAPKIAYYDIIQNKIFTKDIRSMSDIIIMRYNEEKDILLPTYNFGCVIDDYEMGVDYVIRGMDHKENTFYQKLIYYMLGLNDNIPKFGHIPLLLNFAGHKLSKRDLRGLSLKELLNYYETKAILNYIFNILHNRDNSSEHMARKLDNFINSLNEKKIGRKSVRIDTNHLRYICKYHITKLLSTDELYKMVKEKYGNVEELEKHKEMAKEIIDLWKYSYGYYNINSFLNAIKNVIKHFIDLIEKSEDAVYMDDFSDFEKKIIQYITEKYIIPKRKIDNYKDFKEDIMCHFYLTSNEYEDFMINFRDHYFNSNPGPSITDILNLFIKYRK